MNRSMSFSGFCSLAVAGLLFMILSGCGVYKLRDISIPQDVKSVKVNFIENRAPYINPQLSPRLTDRLRQKIVTQTRLTQTNNDSADWVINGTVTNYSISTAGLTNGTQATNRLTVTVHIVKVDQVLDKTTEYDVSRPFDFRSDQSITQAEAGLLEDILKSMTDDIFNRLFSDW